MKITQFFRALFQLRQIETERARLEAFLSAFPGAYCGFGADNLIAYNQKFLNIVGLPSIKRSEDLLSIFQAGDDTRFEHFLNRFLNTNENFNVTLTLHNEQKKLRVQGVTGHDLAGIELFHVLWFEDISDHHLELSLAIQKSSEEEAERQKYKYIFDSMTDPVWLYNKNARLILCNKAYEILVQDTAQSIIESQKEIGFIKKQGQQTLRELVDFCFSTKQPVLETRFANISGARKSFDVSFILLSDEYCMAIAKDRTREDEISKESERNISAYRGFMEHLRTAIALFGTDQRLQFYNSSYAQLWQLDDSFLNTKPKLGDVLERLRDGRRLPEQADFKRYKQSWLGFFTGLIAPHEDMMYLPDGTSLRQLIVAHPTGGLMMLFEDVTSRLQLESSYNTLIAVQKETLDNLAEGVAAYGGDGRLKLWNPSYARMWKLNPEDMDGEPHIHRLIDKMLRLFNDEDQDHARENIMSQALNRSMRDGLIRRNDGTIIEFATIPLPDGGILVTHTDITDTIRVENALREKTLALETAERLKLDFLANVSYQLRTPLNAIIGFTEILDKEYFGELNTRQKEYTKGLGEAGARLMSLINDILDLSTIEAGYMSLELSEIEVFVILKGLHELTQEWARSQRIEVELSCPPDIGTINADERRIKQVLLNLIRNAIEFTPAGGRIQLKAERIGMEVHLSVIDTGPGIDFKDQSRVFKPFEKTNEVRNDGDGNIRGGAGLGLTLVKNIIELHHGNVELFSEIGKGTEVRITLPQ
jgi:signal transduction histidine kinase